MPERVHGDRVSVVSDRRVIKLEAQHVHTRSKGAAIHPVRVNECVVFLLWLISRDLRKNRAHDKGVLTQFVM